MPTIRRRPTATRAKRKLGKLDLWMIATGRVPPWLKGPGDTTESLFWDYLDQFRELDPRTLTGCRLYWALAPEVPDELRHEPTDLPVVHDSNSMTPQYRAELEAHYKPLEDLKTARIAWVILNGYGEG